MVIDSLDNIYFTGRTESADYPVTPGAYDESYNDQPDGFNIGDMIISCIRSDLSGLRYSTFLGNEKSDYARAIDLDSEENVFVVGYSYGGIPEVGPQFNNNAAGGCVMAKLNRELSQLLASNSILAQEIADAFTLHKQLAIRILANNFLVAEDVVIDSTNQLYICGETWSTNLVTNPSAFSNVNMGKYDAFIVRLTNSLDKILASTYIGGKDDEFGYRLMTDSLNNAYLCGSTKSKNFPFTPMAYDTIFKEGGFLVSDAFVCKLDSNLGTLQYSTFLGGNNGDSAYDMVMDSMGNILVTGYTYSTNFPVFCNSFDKSHNGNADGFISKFSPRLDSLMASTYVGGAGSDHSYSISLNTGDTVYLAGYTTSKNFPVHQAWDSLFNGDPSDGFIFSIDPQLDDFRPCCADFIYPAEGETQIPRDIRVLWEHALGAAGYILSAGTEPGLFDLMDGKDVGTETQFDFYDLPCGVSISVYVLPYDASGKIWECDPLHFSTVEAFFHSDTTTICEGETYDWQGTQFESAGTYTASYTDINGCDSIMELNLSVFPSYYSYEEVSICDGDVYDWQGESYSQSGNFTAQFETVEGCDSLFELELFVNPSFEFIEQASICQGDTYQWQGFSLNLPGSYTSHFLTQFDCDSIYYLELEVLPEYAFFDTLQICQGEEVNWQGQVFDSPGEYSAIYQSIGGCDSIYSMQLEVIEMDTMILVSGDTLHISPDAESTYQWLSCPDLLPIEGATGPIYVAESSGGYAVAVEKAGCVDTSACRYIIHSSLPETGNPADWLVYPNPISQDLLHIEFGTEVGYELFLYDKTGRLMIRNEGMGKGTQIEVDQLRPGIYMLNCRKKDRMLSKKIVIAR